MRMSDFGLRLKGLFLGNLCLKKFVKMFLYLNENKQIQPKSGRTM